jgi:pimeloyl-ACP methyl ester carboxylesterase
MWRDFPDDLCKKTGCAGLLYDRLGYGKSSMLVKSRTVHYMHEYALNELPEVLARLVPGRRFFLIGHSDGASIGLIYAAENNPMLLGLITEAAHVFVERETLEGIKAAVDDFNVGKFEPLFKYHGDKTEFIFKAWHEIWLSNRFGSWNIEYLLPSINCPCLVIQGIDDQYGTPAQVYSIVSKTSGRARMKMVANCGHSPHRESADAVICLMIDFIEHTIG